MKRYLAGLLLLVTTSTASAQFRAEAAKEEPKLNTLDAMRDGDSFLSRIFDPARFSMHQMYSMSVASSSVGSYGLTMFTNTFSYRASDDIAISADVSAVYSPFSSFGDRFSKSVNGIYLTSARLDWKLSDDSFLRIEYVGGPNAQYGMFSPFSSDPFASSTTAPSFGRPQQPADSNPLATNVKKVSGVVH